MKITLEISHEDYKTLELLSTPNKGKTIEEQIKEAIKFYIVNYVQYIPYMKNHPEWMIYVEQ